MFNFFKKKKQQDIEAEELEKKRKNEESIKAFFAKDNKYTLEELLEGKESYKIFSWGLGFKDGTIKRDKILPLKDWEPIEEVFTLLEKEYDNIEEGGLKLLIKDDKPSYDGDEIASLQIQIEHGYMRPYLKYRAEGATYAEEWKRYYNIKVSAIDSLEFDMEEVGMNELTKDIELVKTMVKEFYEIGDVSEEYMD